MPKILRIINRFNLGGPTYNVAYLTKYLAPEFETLLVGGEKDDTEDSSEFILESLGITPVIIPEMKRKINFRDDRVAYKKLKKIIREFKPDIVHTHASKAGTLGRMAAHACGVPVIVHTFHGHVFHSYFGKVKTKIFKSIEKRLAKKSDAIIAISELQKKELAFEHHICPAEKITVIPLGFDLSRFHENQIEKRKSFREKYSVSQDEVAIVIIGRLVPVKNHDLFLRGVKLALAQTNFPVRIFIVGDGEERLKLENLAETIGLDFNRDGKINEKKILTFTSWVKEVDTVLAGSDIVCLTSLNEGTPVSLIEAQAAGKAIITSKVGGIENVVVAEKTALLFETNDIENFAKLVAELVNNPTKRSEMGMAGWEVVKNKFHYTRLVKDTADLYHQLLEKRKTPF